MRSFRHTWKGPSIGTTKRCLRLNESYWPKILYRKNYGDKKGSKSLQQQKRCSAGNLDDLLWKCCKSRYADLSCSDVHWNFWRMCNALRLGSEVCNWYWRRRSTYKCLKTSTVFILHFSPSLHFTLSLHFTPGPQSAVCSLRFTLTDWIMLEGDTRNKI